MKQSGSSTPSSHASNNGDRVSEVIDGLVGQRLADVERALILNTLARCGGNRTWAADILGLCVRSLRNKLLHYRDTGLIEITPEDEAAAKEEQQMQILANYQPGRRLPS
ncbi:MAG: helix-turn-helix domain-containing protein [Pseudomonadota bacterium]